MNEEVVVRFKWTVDELLRGHRTHYHHRVRAPFRWAFWVLAAAFIIVGSRLLRHPGDVSTGAALLFLGLYIPAVFLLIRPRKIRRQFARRRDRDGEVKWRISADRLHVETKNGTSDFAWAALVKVVQSPDGYLLYPTAQMFHWLPRHGFAGDDDFARIAELAQPRVPEFHRTR